MAHRIDYQDYLAQQHLAKAVEAEGLAAVEKDRQIREGWLKLAECYRVLAQGTASHNHV